MARMLPGTLTRPTLSDEGELGPDLGRPEVLEILAAFNRGLDSRPQVGVHAHAEGEISCEK